MNLEKRLDAVEDKLNVTMTPHQARHNKELSRRIEEGRRRSGIVRRDPGDYVDLGGSLAERLGAARKRREAEQGKNRTVQE